LIMLPAWLSCR